MSSTIFSMNDWDYVVTKDGSRTPWAKAHKSGRWKIAKYGDSPRYCLWDVRDGSAKIVKWSDDARWLMAIVGFFEDAENGKAGD